MLEVHIRNVVTSTTLDNVETLSSFARRLATDRDQLRQQVRLSL